MPKTYNFSKGSWNTDDFMYVYSPICKAYKEFKVDDDSIIDLAVEFKHKAIVVAINGVTAEVANDDIPDSFHVGITACEGVNKFYDLVIED